MLSLTVSDIAQFALRFRLGQTADESVSRFCDSLEKAGRAEDANVLRALVIKVDRKLLDRPMTEAVSEVLGKLGMQEVASLERVFAAAKTVQQAVASQIKPKSER